MSKNGQHTAVERGGFDPHRVFSQILAGELPAAFVFRNALVSAFMDIQPINPGHVLVVPNQQASCLAELPPETGAEIFRVGQRVAAAIRATTLKCEGINLFLADGVVAGQTVFHVHLHVFPRFVDDGFRWKLPTSYDTPPSREEIEANRDLISQLLKNEM
jgi:histidine triad (HIT) family protein